MTGKDERLLLAMEQAAQILYPKGEADGAAGKIGAAFGAPSLALEASAEEMQRVCKIPDPLAFAYGIVPDLARYMLAERAEAAPLITSLRAARAHLLPLYLGTHYECGHILCLNAEGRLLGTSPVRMGSVDEAPFYTRVIMELALASGGDAFLLAHNHPGGTREPSMADCSATQTVMEAMHRLQMTLIDHIIFTDGEAVSIRASGQMSTECWQRLAPLPESFRDWPE